MRTVVAAVIEREDRRLLIGQRRKDDSSPLKWEFPGGKVREGEAAEAALARELQEELGVTLTKGVEIGRVRHQYAESSEELEIRFFAARVEGEASPLCFEQIAWVLPKEGVATFWRRIGSWWRIWRREKSSSQKCWKNLDCEATSESKVNCVKWLKK
jgi:mutator protein MutT